MTLHFRKYQALGNDMIIVDPAFFSAPLKADLVRRLCDRHFGIGADGICYGPLALNPKIAEMRFFNPDGSEAEKSGNGLRIFARYLLDAGYVSGKKFQISINQEAIAVQVMDDAANRLAIEMGRLSFFSEDIPIIGDHREVVGEAIQFGAETLEITAVSVGNPHCVIFTDNLPSIHQAGPFIEKAPIFPQRTNVQMVKVLGEHEIQIAIWERGAGYTLASGTSACATAGAAVRNGLCRSPITVNMAGGTAQVWLNEAWQATLVGEVAPVFEGVLAPDFLA